MKVHVVAVGRLRSGPERDLVQDYLSRFDRAGKALGLGPSRMVEVEDRRGGGTAAEAVLLRKASPRTTVRVALDERGRTETSPEFANRIARWRDQGSRDITFFIGGADGLDPGLRDEADHAVSFGKMVWPHMLARVMLAEQLFRAASILARSPYHRE